MMQAVSFLGSGGCGSFRFVPGRELASKVSRDGSRGLPVQASAALDAV